MIRRRSLIRGLTAGAALGALGEFVPAGWSANRRGRPNILVIVADDMRWDALGAAGNPVVRTPHLDTFARDGVMFENAFVTTSICPTSRASIFTGQYAARHGVPDFATPLPAPAASTGYPGLLRAAGYRTGFVGKWGLAGAPPGGWFDDWLGFSGQGAYFDAARDGDIHLTDYLGGQTVDLLRGYKGEEKPFCLSLSFKAPHAQDDDDDEYPPPRDLAPLYANASPARPPGATVAAYEALPAFLKDSVGRDRWQKRFATPEQWRRTVLQYYRLVTGLDRAVGWVMSALAETGQLANTLVVFTSDNGLFLGEHGLAGKWWMFEESIRVPLILRLPDARAAGTRRGDMVLNIDLQPTILEAAGLTPPQATQGRSLLELTQDANSAGRRAFYYEHSYDMDRIAKSEGVRTGRWKYMRFPDSNGCTEMLFDLRSDRHELRDLSQDPALAERLAALRAMTDRLARAAR